jgi:hypothetical protein
VDLKPGIRGGRQGTGGEEVSVKFSVFYTLTGSTVRGIKQVQVWLSVNIHTLSNIVSGHVQPHPMDTGIYCPQR